MPEPSDPQLDQEEEQWDLLFTDARLATMVSNGRPYGAEEGMALAVKDGTIAWLGPASALPHHNAERLVPLEGRWMTPGLIDCHTHLVYGGNRAAEFELRLTGATYQEIARAGGGIAATVAATRAASEDELMAAARPRLEALLREGVTVVEIKSGYGLNLEQEAKMLRVARRLAADYPVTIRTSFLGAHAVAPEYGQDRAGYLDAVIAMLPSIAASGLADAVDALLRGYRLHAGRDGPTLRCGAGPRPAGQAACRPALRPRRRGPGRALRGALGGSSGVHQRGGRCRHGGRRHGGGAAAGRLLRAARNTAAARRGLPAPGRPHGPGDRLQPRQRASDLAAADHEPGLHPLPPDAGGSAGRLHPERGPWLWTWAPATAPWRSARPPIWRSGTSNGPASWPIGSASTRWPMRCKRANSGSSRRRPRAGAQAARSARKIIRCGRPADRPDDR